MKIFISIYFPFISIYFLFIFIYVHLFYIYFHLSSTYFNLFLYIFHLFPLSFYLFLSIFHLFPINICKGFGHTKSGVDPLMQVLKNFWWRDFKNLKDFTSLGETLTLHHPFLTIPTKPGPPNLAVKYISYWMTARYISCSRWKLFSNSECLVTFYTFVS